MAEPHDFDGPEAGSCLHLGDGGRTCGYPASNDIHRVDRTEFTVRRAVPLGDRRPEVRSLPDARRRRAVPWNELPAPSKVILGAVTFLGLALLACVVATLCRLILSAGGWLG